MSKKKIKMHNTFFVAKKRTKKDVLNVLKKMHDYVLDGRIKIQYKNPGNEVDDWVHDRETEREDMIEFANKISKVIRWLIIAFCNFSNLCISALMGIKFQLSGYGIIFAVLSVFSLLNLWFGLKKTNIKQFQKKLKIRCWLPFVFGLGTLSFKWALCMLILTVLNILVIWGYLILKKKILNVKKSATKKELAKKIKTLLLVLFIICFIFFIMQ